MGSRSKTSSPRGPNTLKRMEHGPVSVSCVTRSQAFIPDTDKSRKAAPFPFCRFTFRGSSLSLPGDDSAVTYASLTSRWMNRSSLEDEASPTASRKSDGTRNVSSALFSKSSRASALRASLSRVSFSVIELAEGRPLVSTTVIRIPFGPKNTSPAFGVASVTSTRNSGPHKSESPLNPSFRSSVSSPTLGRAWNRFNELPRPNRFRSFPVKMEFNLWCRKTPGVSNIVPLPSNALSGMTPRVVPGIADAVGSRLPGTP
mmetsp:Transcript_6149/g.23249  ORF Transcript_6149/g.23249 Transcript_6149/m.23249 type:complete len:258 (+) Transcript_6149:901-1674(+)